MTNEKDFLIPFSGLKLGEHQFEYHIKKDFFDIFNYNEFNDTNVEVQVKLLKKTTILELEFSHQGTVNVPCDVTNEDFDLAIEGTLKLVVKFGEEYSDENEELLILPFAEYQVNVAQYIYEMIVLSVPYKRVHPDIAENYELDDDDDQFPISNRNDLKLVYEENFTENRLNETEEDSENNKEIDPRWDKLKQLLTDK